MKNEELMSAKARLSDEVESLLSKVALFGECPLYLVPLYCLMSFSLVACRKHQR